MLGLGWVVVGTYVVYHLFEGTARIAASRRQGYSDNLAEAKWLVRPVVVLSAAACVAIVYRLPVAS